MNSNKVPKLPNIHKIKSESFRIKKKVGYLENLKNKKGFYHSLKRNKRKKSILNIVCSLDEKMDAAEKMDAEKFTKNSDFFIL